MPGVAKPKMTLDERKFVWDQIEYLKDYAVKTINSYNEHNYRAEVLSAGGLGYEVLMRKDDPDWKQDEYLSISIWLKDNEYLVMGFYYGGFPKWKKLLFADCFAERKEWHYESVINRPIETRGIFCRLIDSATSFRYAIRQKANDIMDFFDSVKEGFY